MQHIHGHEVCKLCEESAFCSSEVSQYNFAKSEWPNSILIVAAGICAVHQYHCVCKQSTCLYHKMKQTKFLPISVIFPLPIILTVSVKYSADYLFV